MSGPKVASDILISSNIVGLFRNAFMLIIPLKSFVDGVPKARYSSLALYAPAICRLVKIPYFHPLC